MPNSEPSTARRLGIVINPTAGHGRGRKAGATARSGLEAAGHTIIDLSGASVADALAQARTAALDGLDALVVVGGDGMVHLGVNAVVGTSTPLAIVAAGSGNDTAQVLGLPVHAIKKSVAQILAALDSSPRTIDAIHVAPYVPGAPILEDETWGGQWVAGVLSLGLDAAVNARANNYKWPPGHAKYVRAVASCLRNFVPYGYTITTDHGTRTFRGTLVAVANTHQFGGGLRIAPQADPQDGLLDVISADTLTKRAIMRIFPRLYRGSHLSHPAVHSQTTTSVIIDASTVGEHPPVAFADGEVIGTVPLRVQVHPGALRVLV